MLDRLHVFPFWTIVIAFSSISSSAKSRQKFNISTIGKERNHNLYYARYVPMHAHFTSQRYISMYRLDADGRKPAPSNTKQVVSSG